MSNVYFVLFEHQMYTRTSWSFWINYANLYVENLLGLLVTF